MIHARVGTGSFAAPCLWCSSRALEWWWRRFVSDEVHSRARDLPRLLLCDAAGAGGKRSPVSLGVEDDMFALVHTGTGSPRKWIDEHVIIVIICTMATLAGFLFVCVLVLF
uniref:Uncharacterized protein n=1 Tax=Ixodes ricinus TaxID=34613 RepID=A0A6B0UJH9_IXORI